MVIQRLQSVYLLLCAVLMGIFPFVPFGYGSLGGQELMLSGWPNYETVMATGILAAVLYLLDIFLFKSLRLQKTVLKISMLMTAVTMVLVAYYNIAAITNEYAVTWSIGCYMLVATVILALMAMRRIRRDQKILSSYDRLR